MAKNILNQLFEDAVEVGDDLTGGKVSKGLDKGGELLDSAALDLLIENTKSAHKKGNYARVLKNIPQIVIEGIKLGFTKLSNKLKYGSFTKSEKKELIKQTFKDGKDLIIAAKETVSEIRTKVPGVSQEASQTQDKLDQTRKNLEKSKKGIQPTLDKYAKEQGAPGFANLAKELHKKTKAESENSIFSKLKLPKLSNIFSRGKHVESSQPRRPSSPIKAKTSTTKTTNKSTGWFRKK